jgi:hypothetical protein
VTLHGKIAALSRHDVLKTTEPLTCSDGAINFTCLLMKTDISPVLKELRKIEVRPTATLTKHRWVLVLEYNFTENVWHWRNITVVKGWVLGWNNETVYLFQAPIVSYGEMKKIHDELFDSLVLRRELNGIAAIATHIDKITVGTTNVTENDKARPDPKAVERIKNYVRGRYKNVRVEVFLIRSSTNMVSMGGEYPVTINVTSTGYYKYSYNRLTCSLGYVGYLYGDPNLQTFVTAWHCFALAGTGLTSPYTIGFRVNNQVLRIPTQQNGFFIPGPHDWAFDPLILNWRIRVYSDVAYIGANDAQLFQKSGIAFGYIKKADGFRNLPITRQLNKEDVKVGGSLTVRFGKSDKTTTFRVASLCYSTYWLDILYPLYDPRFPPYARICHVRLDGEDGMEGDSGSPVYVLAGSEVWAYGVYSGRVNGTIVAPLGVSSVYVRVTR